MPLQRKVFRIEQMSPAAASGTLFATEPDADLPHREILAELRSLRELMEGRGSSGAKAGVVDDVIGRTKLEIAALQVGPLHGGPARASRELDAIAEEAERATQKIINAAEAVEDAANTLSAFHKGGQQQALAQDILDHVIHIFEACNFQDLSAQRISKVAATLDFVEDRITRIMEAWGGIEAFRAYTAAAIAARDQNSNLHGPKLDDDDGCSTQEDIDALFAAE
jgi:chemotaxis protein CheZ